MQVNMHESKTNLSKLIKRALDGEEIIIAVNGDPKVRLAPIEKKSKPRKPGSAKGLGHVTDSFFEPLPDEMISEFYK
jgi:prevent-host-death family protein